MDVNLATGLWAIVDPVFVEVKDITHAVELLSKEHFGGQPLIGRVVLFSEVLIQGFIWV